MSGELAHDHSKCCSYNFCAHPMCCGYYGPLGRVAQQQIDELNERKAYEQLPENRRDEKVFAVMCHLEGCYGQLPNCAFKTMEEVKKDGVQRVPENE